MQQTLMTRGEFEAWLIRKRIPIYLWPYAVVPCRCGDPICHGWRLAHVEGRAMKPVGVAHTELTYELEPDV